MQSAAVRPSMSMPLSLSLLSGHVCTAGRRSALALRSMKQPGLRPLHASPIFQRPRRRDFFSSNAVASYLKDESNTHSTADQPHPSNHRRPAPTDKDTAVPVPLPKRKTARPSGAPASLRRAALEAQRSRDGKQRLPLGTSSSSSSSSSSPTATSPTTAAAAAAAQSAAAAGAHSEAEGIELHQMTPKLVTAYAVAETFDVAKVVDILRGMGYEPDPLETGLYPQVVHIQVPVSSLQRSAGVSAAELDADDVGDVFIFPSGTLVTWALPESFSSYLATRTLLPAATNPHAEPIESEELEYVEDSRRETSSVRGDTFIIGTKPVASQQSDLDSVLPGSGSGSGSGSGFSPSSSSSSGVDTVLTKIAFSSGFARSTKLAVLETMLSTYLASTASIPDILAKGSRLPFRFSRSFILRKTGQLLQLRAQLNLYSELTDSLPDLFWDSRHELKLENYYDQVGRALDVGIRIKVLNEKMDYAAEIASVLRERLSEKHGTFLEWTIIILIAIEVGFEILRLRKEGFWQDLAPSNTSTDKKSTQTRSTNADA